MDDKQKSEAAGSQRSTHDLLGGAYIKRYATEQVASEAQHFDTGPDQSERDIPDLNHNLIEKQQSRWVTEEIRAGAKIKRYDTSKIAEEAEHFAAGPDQAT